MGGLSRWMSAEIGGLDWSLMVMVRRDRERRDSDE